MISAIMHTTQPPSNMSSPRGVAGCTLCLHCSRDNLIEIAYMNPDQGQAGLRGGEMQEVAAHCASFAMHGGPYVNLQRVLSMHL
jgi:hypothetical protein